MRVYHRTYHSAAILSEGFRDGYGPTDRGPSGYCVMAGVGELRGIFVSAEWPLDALGGMMVTAKEIWEAVLEEEKKCFYCGKYASKLVQMHGSNTYLGLCVQCADERAVFHELFVKEGGG